MSDKKIYNDFPYDLDNKKVLLGDKGKANFAKHYPTYKDRYKSVDFDNPESYNNVILDQTGNSNTCPNVTKGTIGSYDQDNDDVRFTNKNNRFFFNNKDKDNHNLNKHYQTHVQHFRKPRKPLDDHPLNTVYKKTTMNEDLGFLAAKGLSLGGSLIIRNGVSDLLSGTAWKPIFKGATLVGAGVLIYKLTDQDIKKFYRNYVSRLEGNYENIIPYPEYRQFVKKYNFKYEQDYYYLNDILAGREDPIDMNKFMELNNSMNPARAALGVNPKQRLYGGNVNNSFF